MAANPDKPILLEIDALGAWRGERCLFDALSFALSRGELLHVRGPNGSGKSTLLRILCGLRPPTTGKVTWLGKDQSSASSGFRDEIAYLGHADGVKLELTARENVEFMSALRGGRARMSAEAALREVGIWAVADLPGRALSAGQRRRVALSALLTRRLALWILDEPFTALDEAGVALVAQILNEHLSEDGAVVLTSHQDLPPTLPCARSARLTL